jgi:hypothetical protein
MTDLIYCSMFRRKRSYCEQQFQYKAYVQAYSSSFYPRVQDYEVIIIVLECQINPVAYRFILLGCGGASNSAFTSLTKSVMDTGLRMKHLTSREGNTFLNSS